jgi:truncated hemoglobin YjbI
MNEKPGPTLLEWMGGSPVLERLLGVFYAKVPGDPLLAPVFANMSPEHVEKGPYVKVLTRSVFS